MKTFSLITVLFLFVFTSDILGQNPAQGAYNRQQREEQERRAREVNEQVAVREGLNRISNMWKGMDSSSSSSSSSSFTISAFPKNIKLSKSDKILTTPATEFSEKYKDFLKQPQTGLVRVLADLCAEADGIVKDIAACHHSTMPAYGSAYSFRRNEYQLRDWADLQLIDGFFVSDIIFGQGWFVSLGNVEIENVSQTTDGADFLFSIVPAITFPSAEIQFQESVKGIKNNKFLYKKFVPVEENNTYLLRSVAYRGKYARKSGKIKMDMTDGDTRVDIIVAFRVIKKDPDGSVTLLWKELSRKDAPKIEVKSNDQKQGNNGAKK